MGDRLEKLEELLKSVQEISKSLESMDDELGGVVTDCFRLQKIIAGIGVEIDAIIPKINIALDEVDE